MDTSRNLGNVDFCIEEIVKNIAREVSSEKNDPFLTPTILIL